MRIPHLEGRPLGFGSLLVSSVLYVLWAPSNAKPAVYERFSLNVLHACDLHSTSGQKPVILDLGT